MEPSAFSAPLQLLSAAFVQICKAAVPLFGVSPRASSPSEKEEEGEVEGLSYDKFSRYERVD